MFNFLTKSARFNKQKLDNTYELIRNKQNKDPSNFVCIQSQQPTAADGAPETDAAYLSQANTELENYNYDLFRSFSGLFPALQTALKSQKITVPTLPQSLAFGPISGRQDMLLVAQTGSGKTLAYLIPLVNSLLNGSEKGMRALILVPTKELALQVHKAALSLTQRIKFPILSSASAPISKLAIGISTPHAVPLALLSSISYLVLDECDALLQKLNLKKIDNILNIIQQQQNVQISLLSATLNSELNLVANSFLANKAQIFLNRQKANKNIFHDFVNCGKSAHKSLVLKQILTENRPPFIVFCSENSTAKSVFQELNLNSNFPSLLLIGTMNESERKVNYLKFRQQRSLVLVATDVACRGLDFFGVNCVIQYDLASDIEHYIHRSGRSGRQQKGRSVNLYTLKERERGGVDEIWKACEECERKGFQENRKGGANVERKDEMNVELKFKLKEAGKVDEQ
ncbi:ATP-dependent RNA helicase [Spironucleus salmonicida]|uniref:ATP-dependent RNA helicase n=1 Tax=Spironucleus salmonicida TaxID=348837 RepID=V6M640_9EUKA|nr:ATP-dependent RNA helicase [Spironucleus salmonicida]|eukprot:EST48844.1 ATP-dependent RNA helicase [Spironucleus salmonicida]